MMEDYLKTTHFVVNDRGNGNHARIEMSDGGNRMALVQYARNRYEHPGVKESRMEFPTERFVELFPAWAKHVAFLSTQLQLATYHERYAAVTAYMEGTQ